MPHYNNDLAGYVAGKFIFTLPEHVAQYLMERGEEVPAFVTYETSFVPDWRVDNDPRLVAEYAAQTLTEQYMDRRNDEYMDDVRGFSMPKDEPNKDVLFGYDLYHVDNDKRVLCWYCEASLFSYKEFAPLCPQAYDEERTQRAFCYAMLEHFQEHRDANDLPYVTTIFPGKVITRPGGECSLRRTAPSDIDGYGRLCECDLTPDGQCIAARKPDVTRRWKINGNLLGPSAKWFDPSERQPSIAAREDWYALAE